MFKKQQETMGRASAAGKVSMGLKLFEVRNKKTSEAKKAETPKPAKVEMVETRSKKTAFKGVAPNAFIKKGNHWTMMRSGKIDHTIIRPTQKKSATEEIATAINAKAPAKVSAKAPPAGGPTPSVLGASKPTPLAATVAATVATTAAAAPASKRASLVQTMRKSLKAMSVRSGSSEEEEEKRSDDAVKPTEMGRAAEMATIKSVKPEQATIKSKADQATIKSSAGKPQEEQKEDKDDLSELDVSSVKGDANDSDDDKEDKDEEDKDEGDKDKKKKSDDDSEW